jgi:hypothetical protein
MTESLAVTARPARGPGVLPSIEMTQFLDPWDPEGTRPLGPPGDEQGPDPEPIVRWVRVGFLLAGTMVAAIVNAGLQGVRAEATVGASLIVTGIAGAVVLAVMGLAVWALRPARLLVVGKRALDTPDPRERRPRAERARAMGFRGLAMSWTGQAMVLGFLPVIVGLILESLYGHSWELLTFAAVSLLAGFVFQREVSDAVRLAVDDPELRASYGSR